MSDREAYRKLYGDLVNVVPHYSARRVSNRERVRVVNINNRYFFVGTHSAAPYSVEVRYENN